KTPGSQSLTATDQLNTSLTASLGETVQALPIEPQVYVGDTSYKNVSEYNLDGTPNGGAVVGTGANGNTTALTETGGHLYVANFDEGTVDETELDGYQVNKQLIKN